MKRIAFALLLCFAIAGCNGDNGGPVEPLSGTWSFVGGDIFDDSCGYPDPPVDSDGSFTLTNNGDGTLLIDTNDGNPIFECTLSGSNFSCPARREEDIDVPLLDATVHVNVSVTGSFSSSTSASGHETADFSCEGTQCAEAAAAAGVTLPCSYSVNFTATHAV